MSSEVTFFPDALSPISRVGETGENAPVNLADSARKAVAEDINITFLSPELSDEELMEQVSRGSRDALARLFGRHARSVRNVARRILRDESEADDLVQEFFLFLFQKAALFDSTKGTAISWIIQIAYHRAINRRRYLTVRQHYNLQELDEEQAPSDRQHLSIDNIAARELLDRVRDQLSEEQRSTLELHFFDGYSLREIAEKTGQTLGNTRHQFYRGLERLRSCVFPLEGV
jgi:RNA polymerase sigma-70 factor, ECF subfamily